jgi:hypothetical protein
MKTEDIIAGFISHFLASKELKLALQAAAKRYLELIKDKIISENSEIDPKNPDAKVCAGCGKLFVNTRGKNCSTKCRGAVWRKKYPDRKHHSFKDKNGKYRVIWQRKNESIEQFEQRVKEMNANLNTYQI